MKLFKGWFSKKKQIEDMNEIEASMVDGLNSSEIEDGDVNRSDLEPETFTM